MAEPSRSPSFKAYGVERRCYGCGRPLTPHDAADFQTVIRYVNNRGIEDHRAVYGTCCFARPARPTPVEQLMDEDDFAVEAEDRKPTPDA